MALFPASARRARVRPAHVVRLAVYGCDAGLLTVVVLAAAGGLGAWPPVADPLANRTWLTVVPDAGIPVLIAVGCSAAAASYRLSIGAAHYLRFDRPALTVIASQLVLVLPVAAALLKLTWF